MEPAIIIYTAVNVDACVNHLPCLSAFHHQVLASVLNNIANYAGFVAYFGVVEYQVRASTLLTFVCGLPLQKWRAARP